MSGVVTAISPLEVCGECGESEEEESGDEGVWKSEGGQERIRAEKEDDRVKRMTDPRRPTEREVEDHNRTHLPYRNWCPRCVRARGKDLDHCKSIEEERGLPELSFDYCFPGDEFGYKVAILAGCERTTGMAMATVVPMNGVSGEVRVGADLGVHCGVWVWFVRYLAEERPGASDRDPHQGHRD